jgi:hypothetical protein
MVDNLISNSEMEKAARRNPYKTDYDIWMYLRKTDHGNVIRNDLIQDGSKWQAFVRKVMDLAFITRSFLNTSYTLS